MVEFSIDRADLIQALKPFFGGRPGAKSTALGYVDIKAEKTETEFITTGFSSSSKAEVTSAGRARLPFSMFETLFRNPQKLAWNPAGRLTIRIKQGQIQAGPFTLDNPDVSIPARRAELPIGASLQDTLALSLRYSEQELAENGLWDRVKGAQQEAAQMIEKAAKILGPLNITRESLRSFVWDQIVRPTERLQL
jgi:hypothetical protein